MKTFNFLTLVISLLFITISCSEQPKETSQKNSINVEVYNPEFLNESLVTISGQVAASKTVIVSTKMMGYIKNIYVKPGDKIQKGQLLVSINNEDITAKKEQVQAIANEAEAAYKNAQSDYERYKSLKRTNSVSDKEFEQIELQYISFKSKYEMAQQALSEVNSMFAYTEIISPFSGIVSEKFIDEGNMANPGAPILTIEQNDQYHIEGNLPDKYRKCVRNGDRVIIDFKDGKAPVEGYIKELSSSSYNRGGQYGLKISFLNEPEQHLYSGTYVNVQIPCNGDSYESNNPYVLNSSIVHKDQLTGVYVVSGNNQAFLKWVRLGKTNGEMVEVISGIKATDLIIHNSDSRIHNGQSVNVTSKSTL